MFWWVQEANMEIRKQLSFFFKKKLLDLKGGPRIQNDERGKKTTKNPIFQSSYETNKQRDRNREGSKIAGTTQRKMWNRKTTWERHRRSVRGIGEATSTPKTDRNLQERTIHPRNCYSGAFCINLDLSTNKSSVVFCFCLMSNGARWIDSKLVILHEFEQVCSSSTSLRKNDSTCELIRFEGLGT